MIPSHMACSLQEYGNSDAGQPFKIFVLLVSSCNSVFLCLVIDRKSRVLTGSMLVILGLGVSGVCS